MGNENCPCKRKRCERHGKCSECRAHHASLKRPVACEREPKRAVRERHRHSGE